MPRPQALEMQVPASPISPVLQRRYEEDRNKNTRALLTFIGTGVTFICACAAFESYKKDDSAAVTYLMVLCAAFSAMCTASFAAGCTPPTEYPSNSSNNSYRFFGSSAPMENNPAQNNEASPLTQAPATLSSYSSII